MKNRPEGLRDTRKEKSGRPRLTEMTPEEEIQYLKHKLHFKSTIEALKKMNSINRRASKAMRKKNSNSSID
ncbi:hypothetical protein FIU15_13775 [Staphylococcus aureus]|nr:hypothetical protein [Staphylococcus aureus]TNX67212.1 hypothetical protein FIU15_13775 [Staphylococcus aureus]